MDTSNASTSPDPWWTICEDELRKMLNRAHQGEDPDAILVEAYANSDHKYVEGSDG